MKVFRKAGLLILLFCIGVLGIEMVIQRVDTSTRAWRSSGEQFPPSTDVALVFGAGLTSKATLSPILQDRMDGAVKLYRAGVVKKLLLSGDNRSQDYNEVRAMKQYAVAQGIPETDITLDYAGLSTYESCYRARDIFGVQRIVLVTQVYHMPRAVFTCRKLGVEAYGYEVQDWSKYPNLKRTYLRREELATFKMLIEVYVTKPKPTFLGKYEGIQ